MELEFADGTAIELLRLLCAAFGRESLALRRAEGDRYGEAESLALLAAAASARGDEATSSTLLQQSREIRQAIGDRAGVAECDAALARPTALA